MWKRQPELISQSRCRHGDLAGFIRIKQSTRASVLTALEVAVPQVGGGVELWEWRCGSMLRAEAMLQGVRIRESLPYHTGPGWGTDGSQ